MSPINSQIWRVGGMRNNNSKELHTKLVRVKDSTKLAGADVLAILTNVTGYLSLIKSQALGLSQSYFWRKEE
jgi:hypothetical protein